MNRIYTKTFLHVDRLNSSKKLESLTFNASFHNNNININKNTLHYFNNVWICQFHVVNDLYLKFDLQLLLIMIEYIMIVDLFS